MTAREEAIVILVQKRGFNFPRVENDQIFWNINNSVVRIIMST